MFRHRRLQRHGRVAAAHALMTRGSLMNTKQSDDPHKIWWDAKDVSSLQRCFINDKQTLLTTIYSTLYGELRDKDGRQQQAVTWGLTILTGSSLTGMLAGPTLSPSVAAMFCVLLALFTLVLHQTLFHLSTERMSIARQLDRIHQIMGAFEDGYYYKESTLFDPAWKGFGFDRDRDENYTLTWFFVKVLWIAFIVAVLVLFRLARIIPLGF
jgi:hypothetical protein